MTVATTPTELDPNPLEEVRRSPGRFRPQPFVHPVSVTGHGPDDFRQRQARGATLLVTQPWQRSRPWLRVRFAILLPVLLFAFSLYQNLGNMDTVDFHRDEARWINRAYFLEDLLDPFGETWSAYYTTRGQPPLGNYLMGIGLFLQGRDLVTNRVWDFHYEEAWNTYAGAMPDPADLNAGRRTNAVVGALVVVSVYLLASRLTNRVGGFAAGCFLSLQPLHLRLSSQALSDELLALLLALSFLAAWRFARIPTLGNGLLLGALLGLGGATKLSPLLLSFPLAACGALWLMVALRQHGRAGIGWQRGRFGWLLLAQPMIGGAVFVAVNPYLWPAPIGRTWELFNFRRDEMESQSSAWPIAAVESPIVAFERTGRRFNTDYSTSIRIQEWFAQTTSIDFTPIPLDVVFMAAGLVALLAIVVRRGPWSPHALVAYLMAASSAVVIVGMGVDFYRYFLPLLVVAAICVGVGIGAGFSLLANARASAVATDGRPQRGASPLPRHHRGTISA